MSRKLRIRHHITTALQPTWLQVDDESNRHHVPAGIESHFKVTIVSTGFENQNRVARHRVINHLLAEEFKTGLHALSLHLYTPDEWQKRNNALPDSPACKNGYRHG